MPGSPPLLPAAASMSTKDRLLGLSSPGSCDRPSRGEGPDVEGLKILTLASP